MNDIASEYFTSNFRTQLQTFAKATHIPNGSQNEGTQFSFSPEPNLVFQIMFAVASIFAVLFSFLYCSPRKETSPYGTVDVV